MRGKSVAWVLVVPFLAACGSAGREEFEGANQYSQKAPAPAAAEAPAESAGDPAEEHWKKRAEETELRAAITAWEEQVGKNPEDWQAMSHLARAWYFLADGHLRFKGETATTEMMDGFEHGVAWGEKALMALSPEFTKKVKGETPVEEAIKDIPKDGLPAMYWYAASLGKWAVAKGFSTTLFYKDRLFAIMSQVLALDEDYFYGAPHRYFGAFYAKAPSFAGGDMTKSKEHFEKALQMHPEFLGTRVLYAEFYAVKADDRDLYVGQLQKVVDEKTGPEDIGPELDVERKKATDMLTKTDEIF